MAEPRLSMIKGRGGQDLRNELENLVVARGTMGTPYLKKSIVQIVSMVATSLGKSFQKRVITMQYIKIRVL